MIKLLLPSPPQKRGRNYLLSNLKDFQGLLTPLAVEVWGELSGGHRPTDGAQRRRAD